MSELLEEGYSPTPLQRAIGDPLRSEQRVSELLPRVLSRADILTLFIAIILYIPNCSIVQATPGGGVAYVYWIVEAAIFLIPGVVVVGQLNRFMPAEGATYVWTHRAMGPLLGFFAGYCVWLVGILAFLGISISVVYLSQGMMVQLGKDGASWLVEPWQQGCLVLGTIIFAGWFATLRLRFIMQLAKGITLLYGITVFILGLAGVVWLISGHHPQVSPISTGTFSLSGQNVISYGVIILALSGIEVPLNMAAEVRKPTSAERSLRWVAPIVLVSYLLGTFGIMVAVPASAASEPYSAITAVNIVFGPSMALVVGSIFIIFSLIVAVLFNITFARILLVSSLDHRLPSSLSKVNRHGAAYYATTVQTIIVIAIALFTYFIGPALYGEKGGLFSEKIFDVSQAVINVIWSISSIILFLDLPLLLQRFRKFLAEKPDQLIAPTWVLYLCSGAGAVACLLGILTTLSLSWNRSISDQSWEITIGLSVLFCVIVGLISSAYPRLLSTIEEQTMAARENARLYQALRSAYVELSEANQLKDTFLVTAGHELRTPLTIVQGYLELLRVMKEADHDLKHAFIEKACRACDELSLLLSTIMDASRIEFDAAYLHCQNVVLKDVVATVVDLFEPLILQQQRCIEVEIAADFIVWADEMRLKQILHNLVSNALRYSPPHTPIYITATMEAAERLVRVSIRDCGPGIPPDKQKNIFDKFVRLDRDMQSTARGSGLGLFIVKQLVEAMKGTITVESKGIVDEGSTFSFTLPVVAFVKS